MRRALLIVLPLLGTGLLTQGGLNPIANLTGKVDSNNALVVAAAVAGTVPATGTGPIGMLTGKVDSNNNLVVTVATGTITPTTVTATTVTASGVLTGGTIQATGPIITPGTDVTTTDTGDVTRQRYTATLNPALGGAGNCGASFAAAALTADCTIATLPAGMKLAAIYADVTTGFTCSATCTGTKVMQAGTAVGGVQVLAASLNVATTATYGLADADLGSGLVRASAIQGGLIGAWGTTTPISVRFTSGTGNWGTGAATNVNAGTVRFILITEQIK